MRILSIMQTGGAARKRAPWAVYALAAVLAAPMGAAQWALAQTGGPAPVVAPATPDAATAPATAADAGRLFSVVPTSGEMLSAFGPRPDPFTGQPASHSGIDFRAAEGTPVLAPRAGRVTRAAVQGGYGKLIEIDHGAGLRTRYAHLSAFNVSAGDAVAAGQTIGLVGESGRSTEPHLHFEVWRGGGVVDPLPLIPPLP